MQLNKQARTTPAHLRVNLASTRECSVPHAQGLCATHASPKGVNYSAFGSQIMSASSMACVSKTVCEKYSIYYIIRL